MGVVGAEVVVSRSVLLLDVSSDIDEKSSDSNSPQYVPNIRSGSFSDIGRRRNMEDEHINIDDLSSHLHLANDATKPSGFFGVFDGHGGSEASAYVREHVMKLFFKDSDFLENADENNDVFLEEAENRLRNGFLLADSALADASSVNSSSGTTALTALVVGRLLMVANAGDCRAVLSRKGESINMSQDHRPTYSPERKRVESLGGYIEDGYLNGVLSVTRALGDWDMKLPCGSPTPLIAEPEIRQIMLTEEDEFLIIGCDGIWDVISSQQAVSIVRRGLRRHDNPEQCAKDLVMEALHRNTFDNVTVVIVCFSPVEPLEPTRRRMKWCSLSSEALCSLKSFLD